jgi:muramoyltetrapeptide carboxypeptidase LdcA involved in peptidoglycan recycling
VDCRKSTGQGLGHDVRILEDDSINGIISTIGGDDSIRILPCLDLDIIRENPKVFVGYSDTTVSHLACYKAGLTSFYGPAFMSGFSENCGVQRHLMESFRRVLFTAQSAGIVMQNTEGWTV